MIAPSTRVLFASTQGYDLFESFVSDIIYNTRLLKRCQYMTVTYVVVILVAVLVAVLPYYFRLSDPYTHHNPYDYGYLPLLLTAATNSKVPHMVLYERFLYALDGLMIENLSYKERVVLYKSYQILTLYPQILLLV